MASQVNLRFFQGETWPINVLCFDETGAVMSLADCQVFLRIASDVELLVDMASPASISILPAPTIGIFLAAVTPALQGDIEPGDYTYESRVIAPGGKILDQQYGNLTVMESLFAAFPWSPTLPGGGELDFSDPDNSGEQAAT